VKRIFDLCLFFCLIPVLLFPILVIAALVRFTSRGPALHWSDRVGRYNHIFRMPKFRTMQLNTPAVATHLLSNPDEYRTPIGPFLRKSSMDELPQLWSVLKGDMSFVGPRPALFNHYDKDNFGFWIMDFGLRNKRQDNLLKDGFRSYVLSD